MNENIKRGFYALIDCNHLFGGEIPKDCPYEFEQVKVFAVRSVPNRALLFHVMSESGMQRANVPIHRLFHKEPSSRLSLDMLQLWNCFGGKIQNITFDFLENMRCRVILKDKSCVWGTYITSFDWYDNEYSLEPSDYKNAHLIALDNGNYALQPNNRILWSDSNFITKPMDINNIPKYKTDNEVFTCELSDRWISEGGNNFYYDIKQTKNEK